jgi:hypothetical protein
MKAKKRATLRYAASATGLLWGTTLLTRPRLVDALLDDRAPSQLEVILTRVLGARHVVEALALAVPSRHTRKPLLLTEATHAVSMAALAAASPRHRRVALASLAVAVTLGAATAAATRRTSP